jgi:peptidoglycan/LPS O-acetylase OafA/YrhL
LAGPSAPPSPSPTKRAGLRHVPALDGLRGAALLGVLFFHANGALPGGYLGVDLFFVLSGFLITSLLLSEHRATGHIALGAFWIRRARRLFPALLSLMPAIAIYARFFAKSSELQGLRNDALATLAYVGNWRAVFAHKSYWELFASPSPLEHTWSLSIEEQFYVVWPLVVTLLLRRRTPRSVLVLALGLTGLSVAAMLLLFNPEQVSRVYLGTDTRAAGILAGAALATILTPETTFSDRAARGLDALGIVSLLGLGVAWWKLRGEAYFLYHGGFWLTEAAVLVLITCAMIGPRSLVSRVFSWKPLTLVGTVSYGVYLWHWPVNVLLTPQRVHLSGVWLHVLQFALTFLISIVSYRFLEQPIRRGGPAFAKPLYVAIAAIVVSVLLVLRATKARPPGPDELLAHGDPSYLEPGSPGGPRFKLLILGDSTANSLGWVLRGLRVPGVSVELMGKDGCTMFTDACGGPHWPQYVREQHPDATAIFLGGAFLHGIGADGEFRKACYPAWDRKFEGIFAEQMSGLASPEHPVYVLTLPYPLGPYDSEEYRSQVGCINASMRKVVSAVPGIKIIDFGEQVCPGGVCQREYAGATIRVDGVHYTMDGGKELAKWLLAQAQR